MATWETFRKSPAPTVIFYLAFAASVVILEKMYPSGICNPGAGLVLLFALPFASSVLLLKNLFQVFVLHQPRKVVAGLHLVVCLGTVVAVAAMQLHGSGT